MELFYGDAGFTSIYVGREQRSNWGMGAQNWSVELWAGKTYVCASFAERKVKRMGQVLVIAAIAFVGGWVLEPPNIVASPGSLTLTHQSGEAPALDVYDI